MKNQALLPYLVIARINNFTKDKPHDAVDMVWVDKSGLRFVLTPTGFTPAIQYSYMSLFKQLRNDFEKLKTEYAKLQNEYDKLQNLSNYTNSDTNNDLGKKSKKHILGVIDNPRGNYTDAEKLSEIKRYLNFKLKSSFKKYINSYKP